MKAPSYTHMMAACSALRSCQLLSGAREHFYRLYVSTRALGRSRDHCLKLHAICCSCRDSCLVETVSHGPVNWLCGCFGSEAEQLGSVADRLQHVCAQLPCCAAISLRTAASMQLVSSLRDSADLRLKVPDLLRTEGVFAGLDEDEWESGCLPVPFSNEALYQWSQVTFEEACDPLMNVRQCLEVLEVRALQMGID
jgi:hypothetical protein